MSVSMPLIAAVHAYRHFVVGWVDRKFKATISSDFNIEDERWVAVSPSFAGRVADGYAGRLTISNN